MGFALTLAYVQLLLCVLISVAFFTLLERKVLSYSQLRKGPNKLGVAGVLQPFSDALKLFSKEDSSPVVSNKLIFWLMPVLSFFVALLVWVLFPLSAGLLDFNFGVLFFVCCISSSIYGIIFSGWSSNSKYAMLGGLRAIAQTVSYEVVLAFILIFVVFLTTSFNFALMSSYQSWFFIVHLSAPLVFVMYVCAVVETNRAPFDLAEGESELVSGFNVEYGGFKFAAVFLAEYASIFWMSAVMSVCFLGGLTLSLKILFFSFFFLFLRASFPRIRYDLLMSLTWKKFLPLVLLFYTCAFFL